jgi:predicted permease
MRLADVWADVRYALRTLRKNPVFTAVAVSSLALGIGANTALFTLTDAILLRWLPVANPQELAVLARNPERPSTSFNYPDYRYIRDHNQSYTGVAAFSGGARPTSFRLPGQDTDTQLVGMILVSGDYFEVLGVTPAVGRVFNAGDNHTEGAHPYVVLSHGFWERAFASDTGVVGKDVFLNGARFQVVGVSRAGFTGATPGSSPDVFVPIEMYRTFSPSAARWNTRNMWWLRVVGRMKPGLSREQAQAELQVLWQQILDSDPNKRPVATWNKDYKIQNTAVVLAGAQGHSYLQEQTSKPLTILSVTVVLVLLIACVNIANLLLARGAARRKEIAVRLAIGASRPRIVVQMLTESITLSALGGIGGALVAWAGVGVLSGFLPAGSFPVELHLSPDARILGFGVVVSLLSGILFGLAPALQSSKPDLVPALKAETSMAAGGHRAFRWGLRRTLVSVQVALSVVLLVSAGLFVRTLSNLRNLDPGMNRDNLLFIDTNIGQLGYQPQRERMFFERLRDEVQRLPGVRAAAIAAIPPQGGSRWNNNLQIEGYTWKPDEAPHVDINAVTPRYFEAAGIPILLGRDFMDADHMTVLPDRPDPPPPPGTDPPDTPGPQRVAIVNEAFARKFFDGQSPIGKKISRGEKWNPERLYEIVGVVRNARYFDLRKAVEPMMYQPSWREGGGVGGVLTVRTSADPKPLIETIRRTVQSVDGNAVVVDAKTMEDHLNRVLVQERFVAMLGGFFGIVALLLAAIGLYGVMSQTVTRRTREIGIRMALGAEARAVLWLVMREALAMVAVGAAVGGVVAVVATRYAETLLYGITRLDPVTLVGSGVVLLCVTALAGFLPARRATRVEPTTALRQE